MPKYHVIVSYLTGCPAKEVNSTVLVEADAPMLACETAERILARRRDDMENLANYFGSNVVQVA